MVSIVDSEGTGRAYFTDEQARAIAAKLQNSDGYLELGYKLLLALQGIDISLESIANHKKTDGDKAQADKLARDFINRFDPVTLDSE